MHGPTKPITEQEEWQAKQLPRAKATQYKYSRGCVREALSNLLKVPALEIPLRAEPNKAPLLEAGWGYVSFSHCENALFIGWSPKRIGVDIEKEGRKIKARQIMERYFFKNEKQRIEHFDSKELAKEVIKLWVIKEAAIKWQRGKLSSDLGKWHYDNENKLVMHRSKKIVLNVFEKTYLEWHIGIAIKDSIGKRFPIICTDNK